MDRSTPLHPLKWSRVVVAGRLGILTRERLAQELAAVGGTLEPRIHRMTTHLVIGMDRLPLRADGRPAASVLRAERINGGGNRIRVVSERAIEGLLKVSKPSGNPFEAVTEVMPAAKSPGHSRAAVCDLLGIEAQTLRRWEQFGFVHAQQDQFDFQEIVAVRTVMDLLSKGVALEVIARGLVDLSRCLPDHDRPLARMQWIAAQHARVLTRFRGQLMDPTGQLFFDFDPPDAEDQVLPSMPAQACPSGALFERGQSLEEEDRFDEAIVSYRQCVERDPSHASAWFNLGNLLRSQSDEHDEALQCFRAAFAADGQMVVACYNAADLCWDQDDMEEAESWLRHALEISPNYADAHFNLAAMLQDQGRTFEAARYWRAYLDSDAHGPWSEVARSALSGAVTH